MADKIPVADNLEIGYADEGDILAIFRINGREPRAMIPRAHLPVWIARLARAAGGSSVTRAANDAIGALRAIIFQPQRQAVSPDGPNGGIVVSFTFGHEQAQLGFELKPDDAKALSEMLQRALSPQSKPKAN